MLRDKAEQDHGVRSGFYSLLRPSRGRTERNDGGEKRSDIDGGCE
jgi:hypothetical protein